jgi:dephospho-CoA kinase
LAGVPFVGLTGGLGAGKSEALRALGELGAATLSTDAVVHELLASDELRGIVAERLGDDVTSDVEAREWLEAELWPRVGRRVLEWKQEVDALDPSPRAAVVEVPLLFESGMEQAFDATIAVVADEAVRAERAGARGHASVAERTGRQLTQEEKAHKADYEVRNEGSLEELRENLSRVLARLDAPPP